MRSRSKYAHPSESAPKGGGKRPAFVWVLIGLAVLAWVAGTTSAVTVGVINRLHSDQSARPAAKSCADHPALSVAAAPEIAPVVAQVASARLGKQATAAGCPVAQVVARSSADVLEAIRTERGDRPDVWIPDSSVWTDQPMPSGGGLPEGSPSVARSPMVMAVPASAAQRVLHSAPTLAALVPTSATGSVPVRWGLADPQGSPAAVGAVLALQKATAGRSDGPAILGNVLRTSDSTLPEGAMAQLTAAAAGGLAVPVSEQAVTAYNEMHTGAAGFVSAPLGQPGYSFDYPFVVLAAQHDLRAEAANLLSDLHGALGRRLLADAGFRDFRGIAGGADHALSGVAVRNQDVGTVPGPVAVASASQAYSAVLRGSRLLAVVDVSGSMATPVPGRPGATRLSLALQAAVNGLALYPDGTEVGLWTFSTHLTRTTDYAVQVPIVPLGPGPDGVSGRMKLAQALASVTVKPNGNTGLYDTALAAVREVRRTWDPTRANSVVLITDGANDDDQGITLSQLLTALRQENDPARPVALYAVAYGPVSDVPSLTAISSATGGQTYEAKDPATIGKVLMDAIGRRACSAATSCGPTGG
jgi:hypothetical protein